MNVIYILSADRTPDIAVFFPLWRSVDSKCTILATNIYFWTENIQCTSISTNF